MTTPTKLMTVNSYPVVAMIRFACAADSHRYAIVIERSAKFEGSRQFACGVWEEGKDYWVNGNYDLTYQDAIVDAMDRAGVAK